MVEVSAKADRNNCPFYIFYRVDGMKFPNGITCRQMWVDRLPDPENDEYIHERTDHLDLCKNVLSVNGVTGYDEDSLRVGNFYNVHSPGIKSQFSDGGISKRGGRQSLNLYIIPKFVLITEQ